ncbi:beta-2-microglobulin-like [Sphaeramia orbicularis]|uniref:Beta-2-microglobulin n=1 Tax=Sphaeramia orbicularis TaxID=375764 RepID=A0A672YW55_9TELE|nr:beta-2-microglobulin-like [Sphaeramia orbicularis]
MRGFVVVFLLGVLYFEGSVSKESDPKVQVYSRKPGEYGKENILICHVNGFHPPEIGIELIKGGEVIPGSVQSDLAFEESWFYHLTKHVPFTPTKGEEYACRVTHLGKTKTYIWESDM